MERANVGKDAREKALMGLFAELSSRSHINARVGDILVLPKELQIARAAFNPGFFKDVRDQIASEETIGRCVFEFRLNGSRMALQELRKNESPFGYAQRDDLNFRRFELLVYTTALCAIPSAVAADERERNFFLTDVFIPAQEFFDDVAIPAFKTS